MFSLQEKPEYLEKSRPEKGPTVTHKGQQPPSRAPLGEETPLWDPLAFVENVGTC